MTKTEAKRRVTARKYQGDDMYSWCVFIDGRPWLTGLHRSEVKGYREDAAAYIMNGMRHQSL